MSEQIDWSKAPEWADKYGVAGPEALHCWYSDNQYAYISDPKEVFIFSNFDTFSRHIKDFTMVVARPTTPSWSGEGLPPVGVDIEVMHELYGWIGARVVGQDGEAAIVRTNDGYAGVFPHQMRPIRTPEQIAADEREAFARTLTFEMGKDSDSSPNAMIQARRMYDLGYRKQQTKEFE